MRFIIYPLNLWYDDGDDEGCNADGDKDDDGGICEGAANGRLEVALKFLVRRKAHKNSVQLPRLLAHLYRPADKRWEYIGIFLNGCGKRLS